MCARHQGTPCTSFFFFLFTMSRLPALPNFSVLGVVSQLRLWQSMERACGEWDLQRLPCAFTIAWKTHFYLAHGPGRSRGFHLLHELSSPCSSCLVSSAVSSQAGSEGKCALIRLEMSTRERQREKSAFQTAALRSANDQLGSAKNQKMILSYLDANFNVSLAGSEKSKYIKIDYT